MSEYLLASSRLAVNPALLMAESFESLALDKCDLRLS
jgi:hypothetical protein